MRRAFTPTIAFVLLTSGFVTMSPSTAAAAAEKSAGETRAIGPSSRVVAGSGNTGNVTAPVAKARRAALVMTTDVEVLDGMLAQDVNGAGEIAGFTNAGFNDHAALGAGGTVHDLGTLEDSAGNSSAFAINGLGQIVGQGWDSDWRHLYSFVWTPEVPNGTVGSMRALPLAPDGSIGHAFAINDAGQVVGAFLDSNHFDNCSALLWTAGQAIQLLTPGDGRKSSAYAINNVGQVTGVVWLTDYGVHMRGFVWTPDVPNGATGTMIDLGAVDTVYSINDRGQVVGQKEGAAFLWTPSTPNGASGTMTWLPMLQGFDITNEGQVAGQILIDGGENPITHAALWTPETPNGAVGIVTDLDPDSFDPSSAAWALSSQRDGSTRVVGQTSSMGNVLWTVSHEQAPPFSLTLAPAVVTGGNAATGTVVLSAAAPDGGATVALDSDNPVATAPASVTVDAGATTATFEISTTPVAYSRWVSISAVYNGGIRHAQLGVTQPLRVDYLDLPPSIVGGWIAKGTVYLNASPLFDSAVQLSSSAPELATVPASVTVLGFNTGASFEVFTGPVSVPTPVTITAAFAGTTLSFTLILNPARSLESLTVSPNPVTGGSLSIGSVRLSAVAPPGGAVVALAGSDTASAAVPTNVTVPAGATSATFTISTNPVPATTAVTISGTYGGATRTAVLTVSPPSLSSMSVNPTSVTGGTGSTGTVRLSSPAPASGAVVALSSSIPAVAIVPASVSVAGGTTSAIFAISTVPVAAVSAVSVSATYGGATSSVVLTVTPPTLSALSLAPPNVNGGVVSIGTVSLSAPAPPGGAIVTLSSGNTGVATVPTSVTVAAGVTSAAFTVSTLACASGTVTLSGSYGGVSRSAAMTVTTTPDSVAIQTAEYLVKRRLLRMEATSTRPTAKLSVFETSSGVFIGALTRDLGGRYGGQFTWAADPRNVTVRSDLCGWATKDVALK